ncbi:hypothetical protein BDR04DRAFT_1106975 [Suillus decipiens]|nr:hypothetical protein BDR04DRAFT_1106975 [Suillus decipiens]
MNRLAEIAPDPEMLMFGDKPWDAQHVELAVFNPDPLSEEHNGRFFLLSPMILYMAQ